MKIAVLTSGGIAPGVNAALRAAAQEAFSRGWEVLAVEEGYYGLLEGEIRPVDRAELWGYVQLGGTVLGTGRSSEFEEKGEGKERAIELLRDAGAEGLVVIGGGGSLSGGLALDELGLPTVGIPATIDNDIPGTELSIGVDTALRAHFKTPVLVSEADEHGAGMKETNVEYRRLHAYPASLAPGFEMHS